MDLALESSFVAFSPEKHSVQKVPSHSLYHINNLKTEMLVKYMLSLGTGGSHITNIYLTHQRINTCGCFQDEGFGVRMRKELL